MKSLDGSMQQGTDKRILVEPMPNLKEQNGSQLLCNDSFASSDCDIQEPSFAQESNRS
jgi:hypothetical protein